MPKINPRRLLTDLQRLREHGACGSGVVRPAFSAQDMEARNWLKSRYQQAGLDTTIDGVGNVFGRSKNSGPALLIGSHSDTQPTGGWLDGALGVIYGLEVARALSEAPETAGLAVDAVAWQDEESRYYSSLGSRSFAGKLTPEQEAGVTDKQGFPLSDAIAKAGLSQIPRQHLDPDRYVGFLEAHIEQGPHLEEDGKKLGIVTDIVGLHGAVFKIRGQQNHAGTTMMSGRKDAAAALYALANAINEEFPKTAGDRSVWTMGRAVIHPGAASIIPGYAELELQFRDRSSRVLDSFAETVQRLVVELNARGGAQIETELAREKIPPAPMDEGLQSLLIQAAEKNAAGKWVKMPSGAFHDAGVLHDVMPCAMLFIPSIGGVSHDFAENSHDEDIVMGCQVLADAATLILQNL